MKTYSAREPDIQRRWLVVDAEGKTLGRLAAQVASVLKGKHKPMYTPHMDTGDHVIVLNAAKVRLTGTKPEKKKYFHHTMYPGGATFTKLAVMLEKHPERVVQQAVRGMMPKNRLGRRDVPQAEGVRRRGASARRPAARSLEPRGLKGDRMATATTNKPLTGRRKEAVARVRLLPGTGNVKVNDRTIARLPQARFAGAASRCSRSSSPTLPTSSTSSRA